MHAVLVSRTPKYEVFRVCVVCVRGREKGRDRKGKGGKGEWRDGERDSAIGLISEQLNGE